MFKNHIKIAWRNLKRDKLFTGIKIGGFALGIAACLLICLFVTNELGYDTQYANKDRIFRTVMEAHYQGEDYKSVHFQLVFGPTLEKDYPEIEKVGRINTSALFGAGKRSLKIGDAPTGQVEDGFIFGDQNVLDILEADFLEGNPHQALVAPQSMVLTETMAKKYFPKGNAVGHTLVLDGQENRPYTITGVVADFPKQSHIHFNFIMPIEDTSQSWTQTNYFTYVLLRKGVDPVEMGKKLHGIIDNYVLPANQDRNSPPDMLEAIKKAQIRLQPITDIYLNADPKFGDGLAHGDVRFVWLFMAIGVFVLLLACINFINLSTAKAANRAKEVGLKKTIGAFKSNLIGQFLTESLILSVLSLALGVLVAWAALPLFNVMADKAISMPWGYVWFGPILLGAALFVGFLSGLYPAFYLSAFRPAQVLKGKLQLGTKSGKLRSGLVVFQFATSVVLIICTLVVYSQMHFILNQKLGYNKDEVVVLDGADLLGNRANYFKEQLRQLPEVTGVTQTGFLPVNGFKRNGNTFKFQDQEGNEHSSPAQIWRVDEDYLSTLGLQMADGRWFSKQIASDSTQAIVVNQSMVAQLGLQDPLGKEISNGGNYKIIGVVNDFHYESFRETVQPLAMVMSSGGTSIAVKMKTGNMTQSLSQIKELWDRTVPEQAMAYTFLDQDFAQMHHDVERMGNLFNSFALLAIIVAGLGLFALSTYMVEQRRKEIGIRKVLGAPFERIYKNLTWDFLRLIVLVIVIAMPIGGYLMQRWLEDFAYRIQLGWIPFVLAAVLVISIAMLIISFQAIRAARANPIKSLRSE